MGAALRMKRSKRWKLDPWVAIPVAVSAALVLGVGLSTLREHRRTLEASDRARHTVRVMEHIGAIRQLVTDAETGQRGYVLTGDHTYLEPYVRAQVALPKALARLQKLIANDPVQLRRLEDLRLSVAAKLEELRVVVAQRGSGDEAAARETIAAGLGQDYMDRIRAQLSAAERHERRRLRERLAQRQILARNATWLILGSSVAALLVMSLAALFLTVLLRRARTAEARHRDSEERLRVTLQSIGDAVIATDTDAAITFMNGIAESLTGWRLAEARGRRLDEVFTIVAADTREPAESPTARVLREGAVTGLANHTLLLARDGRETPIDDSGAPIRDAGGALVGVVLVFRDVSEREAREAAHRRATWAEAARTEAERTAAALAAARGDAERANSAKDEFLAVLSHELRSPLSAMLAWVGILRRRGDDAPTRDRAVAILERSVRTQTQLIDDLLDVSRIVSGKLRLERGPVDLVAEIGQSLDQLQPAADAKGVRLVRQLCGEPLVVIGDAARLEQIVRNLVDNALKFTPAGGRVTVRLGAEGSEAVLAVIDTGEGFPSSARTVLFDRFRQSATPRTRRHGGLGLGLAIVRHLVEEHGGSVDAESPGPGRGAALTVRLPLGETLTPARLAGPRPDHADVDLHGVSVLVVEDDLDWREAVALRLAQAGADVTAAGTVAEALVCLDRGAPQVLVSDIGMPGADGYELIRRVRARSGPPLRAVAMTGFADADSRERCLRLGFDDFLPKPFEPDRLVTMVGTVLGR